MRVAGPTVGRTRVSPTAMGGAPGCDGLGERDHRRPAELRGELCDAGGPAFELAARVRIAGSSRSSGGPV